MYKVTIAIPVYNVEMYVKQSLLSALDQTFDSIEFLIIDDKGTDKSINIIRNVMETHPRGEHIRIVDHGVNQGTGATKNTAIKEASGEYIYFMDPDDLIEKDCIQILYDIICRKPVDFVAASHRIVNEMLEETSAVVLPDVSLEGPTALARYIFQQKGIFNNATWNKLIRLSFLRENSISCIPHHRAEDVWFIFQVFYHCNNCILINNKLYSWRVNTNSFTGGIRAKGFTKRVATEHLEFFNNEKKFAGLYNDMELYHKVCDFIIQRCFASIAGVVISRSYSVKERALYTKQCMDFEALDRVKLNKLDPVNKRYFIIAKSVKNMYLMYFCFRIEYILIRLKNLFKQ